MAPKSLGLITSGSSGTQTQKIPDEFYGENLERFDKTRRAQEQRTPFVPPRNEDEWSAMLKRFKKTNGPNPDDFSLPIFFSYKRIYSRIIKCTLHFLKIGD